MARKHSGLRGLLDEKAMQSGPQSPYPLEAFNNQPTLKAARAANTEVAEELDGEADEEATEGGKPEGTPITKWFTSVKDSAPAVFQMPSCMRTAATR